MNRHEQKKYFENLAHWLQIRDTKNPREQLIKVRTELIHAFRLGAGACLLCGGTSGGLIDSEHALCRAQSDLGVDTPSLGDRCSECSGRGYTAHGPGELIDPSQAAIDARAPPCEACKGSGAINVEDPAFRKSIDRKWETSKARRAQVTT